MYVLTIINTLICLFITRICPHTAELPIYMKIPTRFENIYQIWKLKAYLLWSAYFARCQAVDLSTLYGNILQTTWTVLLGAPISIVSPRTVLLGAPISIVSPRFSISGPPSLLLTHGLMRPKSLVFGQLSNGWTELFWLTSDFGSKAIKVTTHKISKGGLTFPF